MKLKLITALALAIVVAAPLATTSASAGPLKNTFLRQQARIANGVANGQLTPGEFARLQGQQTRILQERAILKASGNGLKVAERLYLRARQAGASANIFIKKHN